MKFGAHPDLLMHCGELPELEYDVNDYWVQCIKCRFIATGSEARQAIEAWNKACNSVAYCSLVGGPKDGERVNVVPDAMELLFAPYQPARMTKAGSPPEELPPNERYLRWSDTEFRYAGKC